VIDQRAKQYITTSPDAPIYFYIYAGLGNTPASDPIAFQQVSVPDPFFQPSCAAASSDPAAKLQSYYVRYDLYAAWPPTGGAVPGAFPPIKVKTVAFGAIPVTATLQLHQTAVGGRLQPLLDQTWEPQNRENGASGNPAPCDPSFTAPVSSLVSGQVDVSLTDLKVDGVAVDVGASCRTVAPVDVALWGADGYFPGGGGKIGQYKGLHPGSLGTLDSPYYMEQNGTKIPASKGLDIPAFTGCKGSDGDDVSQLVTAMASGPDNPVSAYQSELINDNTVPNLNNLARCVTDAGGLHCPVPKQNPPAMPPH
jgi:hypothetical protein